MKSNFVPVGLYTTSTIKTKKSDRLEGRFAKIRLRELLNSRHAKAFMLQISIDADPDKEAYKFSEQELKNMQNREYYIKSKGHAKKFSKPRHETNKGKEGRNLKMDAVLTLSDKPLSEAQKRVLARGFKFRPMIPEIPVLDIITATESVIIKSKMEISQAAVLRNTVVTELKRMERMEKQRPTKSIKGGMGGGETDQG